MPGPRQPTDVVKANGRKHLSRAEEAQRRAAEANVPRAKTAKPPKWLPEFLKKDFRTLGRQLISAGIYTDLDADTLGRYLVAQHQWCRATWNAEDALSSDDLERADTWGRLQDRYFKQARNCANDMGLTVTSRCRLAVPESAKQKTEDQNPFLQFQVIEGGMAREA